MLSSATTKGNETSSKRTSKSSSQRRNWVKRKVATKSKPNSKDDEGLIPDPVLEKEIDELFKEVLGEDWEKDEKSKVWAY